MYCTHTTSSSYLAIVGMIFLSLYDRSLDRYVIGLCYLYGKCLAELGNVRLVQWDHR